MKELRAIFILSTDKVLWKQIYPIIEAEIEEELKSAYSRVPDEQKILHFIKTRQKYKQRIFIDPKEVYHPKLLEEVEHKVIHEKSDLEYPTKQKMDFLKHYLIKFDGKDHLMLLFEKGEITVIIFPRSNHQLFEGLQKYKNIIANSNFYACSQFGQKLIDFVAENKFHEGTLDALELIMINSAPFGRIIEDDFKALGILLYEDENTKVQTDKSTKNALTQNKLVFGGLVKKVDIYIQENIILYQYGRETMGDIQKIEGEIKCAVDSISDEEVSITLTNLKDDILQGLIMDLSGTVENSLYTGEKSLKFDFLIPNHKEFFVCHYSYPSINQPPVLGSYQRKQLSDNFYRIRIKLDILEEHKKFVRNLKVQLRLDAHKSIASTDLLANDGRVEILGSKVLIWHIPSVSDIESEIVLSGTLELKSNEIWKGQEKINLNQHIAEIKYNNALTFTTLTEDDVIFSMPEKFVEIEFEMMDYLVSGMKVNKNQISIFPTRKLDIGIHKITRSRKYLVFLDEDWDTYDFTHKIVNEIDIPTCIE